MLNTVIMMGRIVKDVELRYTQSNVPVASFRIAVDKDRKNAEGKYDADFFNCTAWRQTGEFVKKHFSKGSPIIVKGSLLNREYTDKDGKKVITTEIQVDNVYFCGSKSEAKESAGVVFTDIEADEIGELPF